MHSENSARSVAASNGKGRVSRVLTRLVPWRAPPRTLPPARRFGTSLTSTTLHLRPGTRSGCTLTCDQRWTPPGCARGPL